MNFEHRYSGEITLEDALAQSINTASVRLLLNSGGAKAVAATAARLGIADKLPNDASLALGTGEVGLLEQTAAYAPFFNGGNRVMPFGLDRIPHQTQPAIAPEHAAMMARMLGAVVSRGSGRAAAVPGHTVAGKTGTTQELAGRLVHRVGERDVDWRLARQRRQRADEGSHWRRTTGETVPRHRSRH